MENEIATATAIELPGGRAIWIPEKGRPFWTHTMPATDLTDDELAEHLPQWLAANRPDC